MTESKNDGGPAFPVDSGSTYFESEESMASVAGYPGMSLRDWFAGMALQGSLAYDAKISPTGDLPAQFRHRAQIAYAAADAMLKERDR